MEGGRGPQLLSGFRFLLPLAPAGYRRQGQVLPFKADFPRLGCAESCLGQSLDHLVLIKMCSQKDVAALGEKRKPSPSQYPFVPCLLSLISTAKSQGKGSGFIRGVMGRTKPFLVPEAAGSKQKAPVPWSWMSPPVH